MIERAEQRNRATDGGWLCVVALRAAQFWDFVDRRQMDVYVIAVAILVGTIQITSWAMSFASHADRPGLEVAAIIAAIMGPWAALQGAAIKFIFDARANSFETRNGGKGKHDEAR